jgi:GH25 family lysozyme M1 (1,4-beta-N-acetylmuramidase)
MYSEEMTYEYKVDMWQYTCEGTVPGIRGPVDINLYFPYEE